MGCFTSERGSSLHQQPRANQRWMTNLPERVKLKPLSLLSIPGSHDSLTSSLVIGSVAGPDQPQLIRTLCNKFPCIAKRILYRWSFTQYKDVSFQLRHGIRYFDIRLVCEFVEGETVFRVLHCLWGDNILVALKAMNQFLEENPQEVIIIDFQHLYNMTMLGHTELVRQIVGVFTTKICPCQPSDDTCPSLKAMIDKKQQVIVLYPIPMTPLFWPRTRCPNPWPNTTSDDFLASFLVEKLRSRDQKKLFVSQGVMTPSLKTVFFHCCSNLQNACSRRCNRVVGKWLDSSPLNPNILITDFVFCTEQSSQMIHKIIDLNYP